MSPTSSSPAMLAPDRGLSTDDRPLYAKVTRRIVPLLLVCYMVSYLDRVNIGIAALQMKSALGFSDAAFGLGAGITFLGYCLLEMPSNLFLEHFGARKTLLRIMVLWGLAATATMFVKTPAQFYLVRFLLGVFEAGFYPGVVLYLTYWFPATRRGRVMALFSSATALVGLVAGPISGATMKYLDQVGGLDGWQWLFLTQGLPAAPLGVAVYLLLKDRPTPGGWLSADECARLQYNLEAEGTASPQALWSQLKQLLSMPIAWALALINFLLIGASYTLVFWMPTLIHSWGVADVLMVGIYGAIPSLFGVVGMIFICRHSDVRKERRWHFVAAATLAALGLWATTLTPGQPVASLVALSIAVLGLATTTPLFITAVTERLPRDVSAPGIAFVTSCGILGAAVSPMVFGQINALTGTIVYSIYIVGGVFLLSGAMVLAALAGGPKAPLVAQAAA
jgi:sugar phosphate permease